MCSKRSFKGLSWQLTNILGLGVPSGGGVGVGLACRSVGDMIWCTVGMKVTKLIIFMKIISTQCTARFCLKMELHILKNI